MDHKTRLEMERSRKREADARAKRNRWAAEMRREQRFRAQFEDTLAKEAQPSAAE